MKSQCENSHSKRLYWKLKTVPALFGYWSTRFHLCHILLSFIITIKPWLSIVSVSAVQPPSEEPLQLHSALPNLFSWLHFTTLFLSIFAHINRTSFTAPNTNRSQKIWSFMEACILKHHVVSWIAEGLRLCYQFQNHETGVLSCYDTWQKEDISFIQQIKSFSRVL